jgi:hypothetical protein
MRVLTSIINRHPGCVLAALMAVVPLSFGLWLGALLYVDRLAVHPYWLFAFWALVFVFFAIVKKHVAKPAVARLAAELCEAGSWTASGSGFSGRIGAYTIVDTWARERGRPFNSLMLECPHRIGFLLERTSKGGVVELAGGRTFFGMSQFGLFPKCPYPFDRGDRLALQTDDIGAFTALTENARFAGALAALEKIPAFRCLISLRVPGWPKVQLKAVMLSPLSGREGLVLIRMVDSPREAAAIRQDLALLGEIRDAMAEIVP